MKKSHKKIPPLPKKLNIKDLGYVSLKSAFSLIPYNLGGPIAEIFSVVITPSLQKRKDEWLETLANNFNRLQEEVEGFSVEKLKDDPLFLTVVMQATTVAMRNHQKEKLDALRNMILNSALEIDLDESLQMYFLGLVDSLTVLHIRILQLFSNPATFGGNHLSDTSNLRVTDTWWGYSQN